MMGGYSMMSGMSWAGMFLIWLVGILVAALIIWGLISLLSAQGLLGGPSAQELLSRRYARGEISREEFEQARQLLRS